MDASTSTETNEFSLLLRALPAEKRDRQTLSFLISHINQQRSSFRDLTEDNLEEEIQAIESGQAPIYDGDDDTSMEEEVLDAKAQREKLFASREEVIKYIMQAQQETALSLDFVSILLSTYNIKQAESTISPILKQSAPLASIAAQSVQPPAIAEETVSDNELVATGWKLQSLNATADSLLASATRLEREMNAEATYWEEVLAVKEKGWSLCRLPRERHTLGVRYGFFEATPEFRDRGLAALRRGDNGSIELELSAKAAVPRRLRVRLIQSGQTVASSTDSTPGVLRDGQSSTESQILQARNSIFDEELYHEMYREARNLMNRGVKCTSNSVSLPFDNDKTITLDMIFSEEQPMAEESTAMVDSDSRLPDLILTASRLLLSHAHRQNYKRRTASPLPLTERRPPKPVHSILRVILAQLQHRSALQEIEIFLKNLGNITASAGFDVVISGPVMNLNLSAFADAQKDQSVAFDLVAAISGPLLSSFKVTIASSQSSFTISIRTHAAGTEYRLSQILVSSLPSHLRRDTAVATQLEMEEEILHLLTLELVAVIATKLRPLGWEVSAAYAGELSTKPTVHDSETVLRVTLTSTRLQVELREPQDGGGAAKTAVWTCEKYQGKVPGDLFEAIMTLVSEMEID